MKRVFFLVAISPLAVLAQTSKVKAKSPATSAKTTAAKISPLKSSTDSFSYAIGLNIATNMKQQGLTSSSLNTTVMAKAMNEVFQGKKPLLDEQTAGMTVQKVFMGINSKKTEGERLEGKKYLDANKKRPGVMVTASGLQYEVLKAGDGPKPVDSNTVKVHYTGTFINGKKFDSSVDRGQPIEFPVTGVIPGWTEALKLMPVGSKWKLVVPSELAYGERGNQGIPGGSTLIFEVELIAITK